METCNDCKHSNSCIMSAPDGKWSACDKFEERFAKDTNVPNMDLIDRQAAIDEVHGAIYEFFDICDDDEEPPMTYQDKKLLEINKAITIRIKRLPSAEKTGRWIDSIEHDGWFCSKCGYSISSRYGKYNYCPECGTRMVE